MTPFNPLPSQRPDPDAPSVPDLGRSLPTVQVEISAQRKAEEEDVDAAEDRELLDLAHERFKLCQQYEQDWRTRATEELNFVDKLQHWTDAEKKERAGRPCLTFDRIGPSIDQVVNDARQNPPEPKISPVGSGSDKWTADVLQGLIRNIDNDSSADIAYMTAYEHAVKVGRGWWRVVFDYENDDDFTQKILVRRIPNLFSVYPDPAADEYDYSDMRFAFVTEDLDRTIFKETYHDAYDGVGSFEGLGDRQRDDWFPNGAVRVAEYWWITTDRERLALLPNGKSVTVAEVPEGTNVISFRWRERKKVHCAKITGAQVLEKQEWPGKWIPLVPVLGREVIEDGKRRLRGMIRPAIDANLSYDYMRSKQVEAVGLAPLAPYMVAEGQLEGYEHIWADANRKALPFLPYKTTDSKGNPVSAPQRNVQEPAIQAITVAVQHADNDIKATLSTYDASLGNAGPESSGRAILARQKEGDNAHFNYHDNLARSMRHTGRLILDLIPHIYTEERAVAIFDPDGNIKQVDINQQTLHEGIQRIFDLANSANRYDVTVGSGPSYASRRAQGQENLIQLVQFIPALQQRAPDLLLKALDVPNAEAFADRVRPPDVKADQEGQQPIPPQVQQMMGQQAQMIQLLTGEVTKLSEVVKSQVVKQQSAERMNTQNNITKVLTTEIAAKSAEGQHLAQLDHDGVKTELEHRSKLLHADLSFEQEQQLQDQQQQHEKDQQQAAAAQQQGPDQQQQAPAGQQPPPAAQQQPPPPATQQQPPPAAPTGGAPPAATLGGVMPQSPEGAQV
jgi:hypothetical protein